MSGLRYPIGELPPEVYWRRRLVVLALLALAITVIVLLLKPLFNGAEPAVTPPVTPATTVSPTVEPTFDPANARACTSTDLTVTTVANPRDFSGLALPFFDATIEHVGFTPCLLDTADGTEFKVWSGTDDVFNSTHCTDDATVPARQFLLQPGDVETFGVTWNRQRSQPGCTSISATPQPGTYHAQLTLSGAAGNDTTFTLSD